ncbi:hypothetical protein HPP92_007892 [Vanilla planifolia]|uniref:Uncharacterized protein n=1 Tax=Vanilla planifolia TaxID=51239 RepID=A0A835RGV4_VANPL|nr:hypothetical protein HPP92_007892 [Vanilla planifolia]
MSNSSSSEIPDRWKRKAKKQSQALGKGRMEDAIEEDDAFADVLGRPRGEANG